MSGTRGTPVNKLPALKEFAVCGQGDQQLSSYNIGLGVTVGQGCNGGSERAWVEHLPHLSNCYCGPSHPVNFCLWDIIYKHYKNFFNVYLFLRPRDRA